MIDTKALRNKILDAAIRGKLTEQLSEDGTAEDLYKQIQAEKQKLIKEGKIKKEKVIPVVNSDDMSFDIPNNWKWVRLGDISSYAQPKRKISLSSISSDMWSLDLEDIEKDSGRVISFVQAANRKITGDKVCFERGQILYSKLRPYLRKILIAPESGVCTSEIVPFSCYSIDDTQYILQVLRSPYVDSIVNEASYGVKMPRVSTNTMKNLLIPLPPLAEQKRIANKIKALFLQLDLIDKLQNQLSENAAALRNKIIELGIEGKLTEQLPEDGSAEDLYKEIQAEKQKLIKEGKLKKDKNESYIFRRDNSHYEKQSNIARCINKEIPFDIPKNWKWVRWGNLSFSIQYGFNAPALTSGRIRMVRISDIQNNMVSWDTVPYCNIGENEVSSYLLEPNDILFARTGGTVGKSYLVQELPYEAVYAGYLIRTRYSSDLVPTYMKYFMESSLYWEQLREGTIATAQPNCNGKTLSKMIIPLPPLAEQKRIVTKLNQFISACDYLSGINKQ